MAVDTEARERRTATEGAPGPISRGDRLVRGAAVAVGAGSCWVVGRDGSPGWQLVRVTVVALLAHRAVLALQRGSRARRRGVAFAAGLLGVAEGVGIGGPHLAKAGLGVTTIAGLLCLAGGLILLVVGGAGLVRAARGWRRAAMVPGLLVALFVVVLSLGQAIAATNVPRTSVGSTTPADLGTPHHDVEFETTDGVVLSGWYIPSANRAAVVLLHGAGSTRSSVLEHAAVLARHGYGVLLFDARGHGRSGGQAMDFGWYGDEDTAAAVSFLQSRPDVDGGRIGAVGMSMGGEEAIGAAAADGRIRAVVAEGATNRVAGDKAWLSDEYGWRGAAQEGIEWLLYSVTDLLTAADAPIALRDAVAAAAPRPVLLIAGGAVDAEPRAGRFIEAGSPDTVELWVVPGAGHTAGLDTDPAQWEQRVTAFLAGALAVGSP